MLTLADISQFRELLKSADYAGPRASACGKPRAEAALVKAIRPHLAEMLAAAEALSKIKAIDADCTCYADFSKQVVAVLVELERGHG